MSLLEVIGVTQVNNNFSIIFSFFQNEKAKTYDWAVECIRLILNSYDHVFVTDGELPLIKANEKHFPESKHLLCTRHIEKDVETWVKRKTHNGMIGTTFTNSRWTRKVRSTTENEFLYNVKSMFSAYKHVLGMEKYCMETWLNPYKEKFVSLWTDKVLHLGNTTPNRAEGAHASLKRQLGTSICDFGTVFGIIHKAVDLQIQEIKRELERSKTIALLKL